MKHAGSLRILVVGMMLICLQSKGQITPFIGDLTKAPKKHTASPNVSLVDSAFYIPQLERSRSVWIYLPPDYTSGKKKYPVLYMTDGQNCFDEFTSSSGEWKVDETLDNYFKATGKSMIVVAVANDPIHKVQEYNPYDTKQFGVGEGKAYARFLVETLKPFIDNSYRTRAKAKNTFIAGSSIGGVIAMWTAVQYPETFGKTGIFSPSLWTARPLFQETEKRLNLIKNNSFFLYAGAAESEEMVADIKHMYRILTEYKSLRSQMIIDEKGQHNETAWSRWFRVFVRGILR